jgi:hypothetical protein
MAYSIPLMNTVYAGECKAPMALPVLLGQSDQQELQAPKVLKALKAF